MKKYLIIALLPLQLLAVSPIKKGEPSPVDGFVFSKEEELKLREINEKKIRLEDLSLMKSEQIEIQTKRIDNLQSQVDYTNKKTFWTNTLYFIGGVALGGGLIYLGSKVK